MQDEYDERKGLLEPDLKPPPGENKLLSHRYRLAYIAFCGFFVVYALRVNLSVAIVKMKSQYNWSDSESGEVLASFFYGYILTQIPGGLLSTKIGAKWVFGFGVLTTSVLTIITPLVAAHRPLLIAVRIIEGIGEGVTFPSMHAMWARWAPPLERTRLCSLTYSGAFMGTVLSMPISGVLAKGDFLGGWPSVFYTFGAVGVIWFYFWAYIAQNDPATHTHISEGERRYIVESIAHGNKGAQKIPVPWLSLLTSLPLWAVILAHTCNNWGFYTLLTCLPSFFNDVLQFDIADAGWKASMPYLLLFILANVGGLIADWMIEVKGYSRGFVRKLFNTAAFAGAALFLILTGFVKAGHDSLAVLCLTLSVGSLGLAQSGFNVNHLDIGPRFGGILMGITNTVATIPGFAGPVLAGILTPCMLCKEDGSEYKDQYFKGPKPCPPDGPLPPAFTPCTRHDAAAEWREVFYICAAITLFGMLFFLLFSSGKPQKWNGVASATKLLN